MEVVVVPEKRRKFSPEFKDEAVKLVIETSRPIAEVARDLDINEGTLGNWVKHYRDAHAGEEQPLSIPERAKLRELERENRDLRMQNEFLKKPRLLREGGPVTDKYEVIDIFDTREEGYPVAAMCAWLGVSRSGFYDWRHRPDSGTAQRRERLKLLIGEAFKRGRGAYGYRRVAAQLTRWGETCSPELVRALMRELGLRPCQPRPYKRTTIADDDIPPAPDLIGRQFSAERPGQRLVGDITYVRTWQGWLYLATVIDCFDRRVIGWAMAEHMRAELVGDALAMAATNVPLAGAVFHSDYAAANTPRPSTVKY